MVVYAGGRRSSANGGEPGTDRGRTAEDSGGGGGTEVSGGEREAPSLTGSSLRPGFGCISLHVCYRCFQCEKGDGTVFTGSVHVAEFKQVCFSSFKNLQKTIRFASLPVLTAHK